MLNNLLTITGADSAGTLVKITGADASGDTDTMVMVHAGDASALKITTNEPAGTAIEVVCDAAQTSAAVLVDGSTGAAWLGASNVGMVHLQSDGGLADVAASLLYIANSGVPGPSAMGSSLRIVDTGTLLLEQDMQFISVPMTPRWRLSGLTMAVFCLMSTLPLLG